MIKRISSYLLVGALAVFSVTALDTTPADAHSRAYIHVHPGVVVAPRRAVRRAVRRSVVVAPLVVAPIIVGASAHVNWCLSKYRSYHVPTDTFQPYNGPRKNCVSPYFP
ncbi:MAG: hypothetical protein COA52_17060 [Hyphomicrobiales bacterium]|nr:BA14K family protein [Hyphomicrobiales bacterium]PCJ84732.1 MAG: hypothetical protein COA52_17060 [Hyphomicrobiales bacterium]